MRLFARATAVLPIVVALMALSAHAFAAPNYPPVGPDSITVSSTAATAGGSITVSAKTFRAGSDVDVTTALESDAASSSGSGRAGTAFVAVATGDCATGSTCTVVASSAGVATATVELTATGPTLITLSGVDPDGEPLTQTVAVDVATAAPEVAAAPAGDLATTGPADLIRVSLIGAAMLAAGFVLVLLVRRRRDAFTAA